MYKVFHISPDGGLESAAVHYITGLTLRYRPNLPTTGIVGPIAFFGELGLAYKFLVEMSPLAFVTFNTIPFEVWHVEVADIHALDADYLPFMPRDSSFASCVIRSKAWWESGDLPYNDPALIIPSGTQWAWTVTPVERVPLPKSTAE